MTEPKEFERTHEEWRDALMQDEDADREEFILSYYAIRELNGSPVKGEQTRTSTQFTITNDTRAAWDNFMLSHAGIGAHKGRGISSALATIALELFIALFTGYKTKKVAGKLVATFNNRNDSSRLMTNLKDLLEEVYKASA